MKKSLILLFVSFAMSGFAQETDTTIYKFVDEMPRFPGCEQLDTTVNVINQCAQSNLLRFFNSNIVYPLEAREQEIEGQVVIRFVVEKDGLISNPEIVKGIGGGCGEEAIRVAEGMNEALREADLRWKPGVKDGQPVRTLVSVPIKFKLQDPPDFVLIDFIDTVYITVDDSLSYREGPQQLSSFLDERLKTPEDYRDSCKVGIMDVTVLVRPNGYVRVIDLTDYWNLGIEFQWEAIRAATATWGKWEPAVRNGREVPSSFDFSVTFLPDESKCPQAVSDFSKAEQLAAEGSRLFNEGSEEDGIARLTEAIKLFPENVNYLYLRGQAYMNMDKRDEACDDFRKVRSIATIDMVEQLLPLICQ